MKILDRYIIRQFSAHYLLTIASIVMIFLLVDIFERLDTFQEHRVSFALTAYYYVMKIPFILDQMAPAGLLIAGIVTVGLLINSRGLQTLNSAGISRDRVLRPVFMVALFFTILSICTAQWLLPFSGRVTSRIWQEKIIGRRELGVVRDGITFFKGGQGIYSFTTDGPGNCSFQDFRYESLAEDQSQPEILLYAQCADWSHDEWRFTAGQIRTISIDGLISIKPFSELSMALPENPSNFSTPSKGNGDRALSVLISEAVDKNPGTRRYALSQVHRRLSFLTLGFPLLFLAVSLLLRFERSRGLINLAVAVPASTGIAFCAWGAWSGLQAMTKTASLNPIAASWSIHAGCIAAGILINKRDDLLGFLYKKAD